MPFPLRELPVMQNWDCRGCGDCCRRLEAVITDDEKRRIEAMDLANDPEVAPGPWFAKAGLGTGKWRLNHRSGGGCVFLTPGNRCRIQERFGAEAKPFACRLFPYLLIPAGDHWRVGMRYSCPSAAANEGRPVAEAKEELVAMSRLLERHVGRSADAASPPELRPGESMTWPEACRVVEVLVETVRDRGDRLERRLRKCLAMAGACGRMRMENLKGHRLGEFLRAVRAGVESDVPRDPADVPPPDRLLGGLPFRVLLAIFAGRDLDVHRARGALGRLGRVYAGWRFARGRGRIPRVNEFLDPATTFEEVERRVGVPAELDGILERYYAVKLSSMQFFGPPNFDLPFWSGLESLILTLPMILWLTRAQAGPSPTEAAERSIRLVDDHFGGDRMLALPHIRALQRTLAERGELSKLVAWYAR